MILAQIPFPNLDPVALDLGFVSVKWYGLAYLLGLLIGWFYVRRLLSEARIWPALKAPFAAEKVDDLLIYITIGVILGGRLGFVSLYEPGYYIANPLEIVKIWRGGMSFHGALLGSALAIILFARNHKVSALSTMDLCTAAVPVGLIFGRIANFINAELYGRVTDVSWGVIFCNETIQKYSGGVCPAGTVPRHPSQLYEAALEGLLLFVILRIATHRFDSLKSPGVTAGLFLIGYGLARSAAELVREPHVGHAFNIGPLTAGIAYCIPMIAVGLLMVLHGRRHTATSA
ncbi:MAG: prolipoprotein diacylglyceryl transferase [Alphaproteobacteria bacterium]|nr:prolipoprotein diacylglyceryl transferase [Alphaproteobacteria bacterium]